MQDLAFSIEENEADVTVNQLPVILGTKFQIQQLFVNLISNALKYVKSDVAPRITVKTELFEQEYVSEKLILGSDFYKISVSDNGIGFDDV